MFEVLFVGHIFVINLVYGMFAFDARTAEKIALKMGPSLPEKRRVGKGPKVLVTLGYASLRVQYEPADQGTRMTVTWCGNVM